jgi:AcrR family transcriptional regulator
VPKKNVPAKPQPYHHGDLRRAVIETALQMVNEEQDWTFSLREVARRAGVSHRAPYNHFPEKLDLLAAICRTYIRLGRENPALYRLMFGPALSASGSADRPTVARLAGAEARGVLECVILHGARSGTFTVSPENAEDVAMAALAVWSATHGLTMLAIDRIPPPDLSIDAMIERLLHMVVTGLRKPRVRPGAPRKRRIQP